MYYNLLRHLTDDLLKSAGEFTKVPCIRMTRTKSKMCISIRIVFISDFARMIGTMTWWEGEVIFKDLWS